MQIPTQGPDWLTQAVHNAGHGDGDGADALPAAAAAAPQTNGAQSPHAAGASEAARGAAAAARPLPSDDFDDEVGIPLLSGLTQCPLSALAKLTAKLFL